MPKTFPLAFPVPVSVSWAEAYGRLDGSHFYLRPARRDLWPLRVSYLRDKADTLQDRDQQEAEGHEAHGFLPVRIPRKNTEAKAD